LQTIRTRLIFLNRIPFLTRRMIRKIIQFDKQLLNLFSFTPSEISEFFAISAKKALIIHQNLHNQQIKRLIKQDSNICRLITIYDKDYPPQLRHIHDAPLVLYALGDVTLTKHTPSISVIGTRNPTIEAPRKLLHFVSPLIENNWLIVSGLAYGIDSLAHQITLNHHGKTIAVLGSGFHHVYPKRNVNLFKQIIQKGLVLSEYPPEVRPQKHHFPERNRIISGISNATLVVEATEKSGTLITVDQALDQGKEVYVVPGSPLVPQTVGCHKMIQDGAKLVITAQDIEEDWY